jgi:uncharacterized protein
MNRLPTPVDVRPIARFNAALLKVASRCNLDCDYCYMYKHADQSWRNQPKLMSDQTVQQFGLRLAEYIAGLELQRFSVILHGGEPLLYSAEGLVRLARQVRSLVIPSCRLDFSVQSNGVLLTEQALSLLAREEILVSLSLDGPRHVHDRHRLNHRQHSTFDDTVDALRRLIIAGPQVFSGVIAVIDHSVSPRELFEFFSSMELPRLDLLLPDATHTVPPPGRLNNESCYRRWLEEAFVLWFNEFPGLPIRWFDAVLGSRLGIPSSTDVMGLGAVSLVVIETNGSYTDHDVFKIVDRNGPELGISVFDAGFGEVAKHPKILEHGYRLTLEGLSSECKTCPVVEACGGGCVMHRAHPERGLNAPTVYCSEMFGLIRVATQALRTSLAGADIEISEHFVSAGREFVERCQTWRQETEQLADARAQSLEINRGTVSAAAVLLPLKHDKESEILIEASETEALQTWLASIRVHSSDPRLTQPFLESIRILPSNSAEVCHGFRSLDRIESCLSAFDPWLPPAMAALLSDLIFVESTLPGESGIFSFSDDRAPNVIYIAPHAGGRPVAPDDLADSIYHEFLHQVLYHIERSGALLLDRVHPRFPAPWRPGLRHSGGFLHGAFVFTGLAHYWTALASSELPGIDCVKARRNAERASRQAAHGLSALRDFALLTPRGLRLVQCLAAEFGVQGEPMRAPGVLTMVDAL